MRKIFGLILLLAGASAGAAESVLSMQNLLENRIRPVVREIDPKAHVFVTLKTKKLETELPMTPFVFKDYVLEDAQGQVQVQKLEVLILASAAKEFPPSMKKLIRELAGAFGALTVVSIKAIPSDFQKYAEAFQATEPPRVPAMATIIDESPIDAAMKWFTEGGGWHFALFGLGVLFLVTCLLATRSIQRGSESIEYAVKGSVDRILIAADKHVPELAQSREQADPDEQRIAPVALPAHWEQLSDDAFTALLTDCYWGEFDSYASFLWKRIPLARRKNLLARQDFLADYATYLSWVREDDFGHEQEPYYLAPFPLAHLDNAAMTDVVRKHPTLLLRLPALRLAGLKVDPKERISLTKTALSKTTETLPDFSLMPKSARRKLSRTTPMAFRSEAEETEMLSLGDVSPEIVDSVPTLGWLARLNDVEIAAILGRFSARELATAWVAPESVLSRLSQQLPAQKLRLLQNYKRKSGASRHSPIFLRLHRMAAQQWKVRAAKDEPKLRLAS